MTGFKYVKMNDDLRSLYLDITKDIDNEEFYEITPRKMIRRYALRRYEKEKFVLSLSRRETLTLTALILQMQDPGVFNIDIILSDESIHDKKFSVLRADALVTSC